MRKIYSNEFLGTRVAIVLMCFCIFSTILTFKTPEVEAGKKTDIYVRHAAQVYVLEPKATPEPEPVVEVAEEPAFSDEEIELIALCTVAEAEGESELGKRLVIDTILNRIDHERFPDTAYDVIYAQNQFVAMTNGRAERCVVTDDIRELVKEEIESRTDHDVIFFRTGQYSSYGIPLYKIGNHYFSSYE